MELSLELTRSAIMYLIVDISSPKYHALFTFIRSNAVDVQLRSESVTATLVEYKTLPKQIEWL